jgi:deoxyribodipyrimidine photo-lyase
MKKYQKSVFLFRRDLRIVDNTGLIEASKSSNQTIPCFILDPNLLKKSNPKFSKFRLQFLQECLVDLDKQLQNSKSYLHILSGKPEKIIENLINLIKIDVVFVNTDYTQFSKKRDKGIRKVCSKYKVDFVATEDLLLHNVDEIKTLKGEPYKVFTSYFSTSRELSVRKPQNHDFSNLSNQEIKSEISSSNLESHLEKNDHRTSFRGGRESCLSLLNNLKNLKDYDVDRNYPAINGTSMLSAHNRFGTCSIREFYHKILQDLGSTHTLIAQLHWRDFFTYIMHHYPHSFSHEFNRKYQKIPWSRNKKAFTKWCEGKTGFPIVDAGMRELNETGFMHNRVRMIVASFLTKDLHIDWRWGEQYFASKLIDYDPSVNIGNWQWAASTGCDAQPWFRIFNPWLQQQKFDPDCIYIKREIPELENISSKVIHRLGTKYPENMLNYAKPMIDHRSESSHTKEIFKEISKMG